MKIPAVPSRRAVLAGGLCMALPGRGRAEVAARVSGHRGPGPIVPPVQVAKLPITLDDGDRTDLATLLRGQVTALQFILTGCGSFCPILGTIFARVQDQLGATDPFRLLSLSLDPMGDTPQAITLWLAKFGAGPHWHGAIPQGDIVALLRAWGLSTGTSSVFHTETVLLVDRGGRLMYRFADLPDPVAVAAMMRRLANT